MRKQPQGQQGGNIPGKGKRREKREKERKIEKLFS